MRVLIGRRIKPFGEGAVHVGRNQTAILLIQWDGAVPSDRGEQPLEVLGRAADHSQLGVARIVATLPDADLADLELSAQAHDLIEHLGQNQAVDDVPDNLHVFDKRGLARNDGSSVVRQEGRRSVHRSIPYHR